MCRLFLLFSFSYLVAKNMDFREDFFGKVDKVIFFQLAVILALKVDFAVHA